MNEFKLVPVPKHVSTELCTEILEAFVVRTERELMVELGAHDERYSKACSLVTALNRKSKQLGLQVKAVQRANRAILIK